MGSRAATKRFTSSTRTSMKIICSAWRGAGSIRRPLSEPGQFEIRTSTDAYLCDGRFDPDRMLQVFEQTRQR